MIGLLAIESLENKYAKCQCAMTIVLGCRQEL